jgi:glycosyl transferase family 1
VARRRPRVLVALPELFPSTVINVAKPLMRLVAAGAIDLDLALHVTVRQRQIERADVLVMSHTIHPSHTWILDCAQAAGTPLVYDIDENLLEPPEGVAGLDFHRAPARQAAVRRALSQAAIVRTYAPALQRYLMNYGAPVVRTDGPIDWRLVPDEPPRRATDGVHIVYATSRVADDSIGAAIVEPLRRLLDENARVDVTIWGPQLTALARHPRVRFRPFVRDYDRYFAAFARSGFDIGLAPMPGDLFYQSKTATKFREYAACRIAGLYADVEMYRDCVTDGDTGLLVEPGGADAWLAAMRRLIDDRGLRERIQSRAFAYARERYSAERIDGDWLAHIEYARQRRGDRRAPDRAGASARPSAAGRIAAQLRRIPAFVRAGGARAAWTRAAAQASGLWQLFAWELAIRRVQRHHRPTR